MLTVKQTTDTKGRKPERASRIGSKKPPVHSMSMCYACSFIHMNKKVICTPVCMEIHLIVRGVIVKYCTDSKKLLVIYLDVPEQLFPSLTPALWTVESNGSLQTTELHSPGCSNKLLLQLKIKSCKDSKRQWSRSKGMQARCFVKSGLTFYLF